MNREVIQRERVHPGVEGVIESYELAFRMQGRLPEVMDLARESAATQSLYGLDDPATSDFGRQCLLARRITEAGVRFVELAQGDWDQHRDLKTGHLQNARAVDRPIAGLLSDLRARGLLDETLVIWGGEFGRTPHGQNADGRDHNNKGFTVWLAGGSVKPGTAYGQTGSLWVRVRSGPHWPLAPASAPAAAVCFFITSGIIVSSWKRGSTEWSFPSGSITKKVGTALMPQNVQKSLSRPFPG